MINLAASEIIKKTNIQPQIALILGSGLGELGNILKSSVSIPYEKIEGFSRTTVPGHKGQLTMGTYEGKNICAFRGRFHLYEGNSLNVVTGPIDLAKAMGVETVIITNASGGINENFQAGDICLIEDHINLTGMNPLIGPNNDNLGQRFPDMSEAYCKNLREIALSSALKTKIPLRRGVYAGVLGPSYETPAEVRMLRTLGADLVGMSTVVEVIKANYLGLKVLGLSCVTNMAAGILPEKLSHEDVSAQAKLALGRFEQLLGSIFKEL